MRKDERIALGRCGDNLVKAPKVHHNNSKWLAEASLYRAMQERLAPGDIVNCMHNTGCFVDEQAGGQAILNRWEKMIKASDTPATIDYRELREVIRYVRNLEEEKEGR